MHAIKYIYIELLCIILSCFCLHIFLLLQAARIVVDYKWSLRNIDKDSEEYQTVKSEVTFCLTNFRRNKLPYTIYWKCLISILGVSCYVI